MEMRMRNMLAAMNNSKRRKRRLHGNTQGLGPNLVIGGAFFSGDVMFQMGTGVSVGNGFADWDGTQTANSALQQYVGLAPASYIIDVDIGATYRVGYNLLSTSGGLITSLNFAAGADPTNNSTLGEYFADIVALNNTGDLGVWGNSNFVGTITDLWVRKVL